MWMRPNQANLYPSIAHIIIPWELISGWWLLAFGNIGAGAAFRRKLTCHNFCSWKTGNFPFYFIIIIVFGTILWCLRVLFMLQLLSYIFQFHAHYKMLRFIFTLCEKILELLAEEAGNCDENAFYILLCISHISLVHTDNPEDFVQA